VIPDIGVIIGAYATVRLIEILCSAESRFASKSGLIATKAFAACGMVVIAIAILDLLMASQRAGSAIPDFPSLFNAPPPRR
jgi:hypothetical protein